MQIDIQTPDNVKLTDHLESIINQKVEKLEQIYQHIMDCTVYLHDNGHGINDKEIEIKVTVKDNTLFAKEKENSFEKALDLSVEAMRKQVQKYKEKKQGK
jgi:putative sigma-54 modulation protein